MRKLALVFVDSLRPDTLARACAEGAAPNFAELLRRGTLVEDCVSAFPSVTPVATSEIVTGQGPDQHWVPGINWYHRVERRYVEYGTSWEATRTFGVFRTLYDTVYNLNMAHLSGEVETIFERLADAGIRTACTPFLVYRGRTRHGLGLEGLLRRAALAARFHHAVWGPDELFYGELYASQRVPCKPTLARPGTRDEYSGCVARELTERDLYDFMLFSLPDHDYHSHKLGPAAAMDSLTVADRALGGFVEAAGGIDRFCEDHGVIVLSDHAQTPITSAIPLQEALASEWRVLQPNDENPRAAELAVSPIARAGGVYVLTDENGSKSTHRRLYSRLRETDGVALVGWLADPAGTPVERGPASGTPAVTEAVVGNSDSELRFRPGSDFRDERGNGWDLEGDRRVLELVAGSGGVASHRFPNALERLWSALVAPHAPDLMISAEPGYELVDWGGVTHMGGGSHGALDREDSLGPLLMVGLDGEPGNREQWSLRDVLGLVLGHFGVPENRADAA